MQALLQHSQTLVRPAVMLFGLAPERLQTGVLSALFNQALRPLLEANELDFLGDAWVQVHIRDINQNWFFSVHKQQIQVARQAQAKVCFSAALHDLLMLASQSVDPDTLFFQRKLSISGDTELGLALKNLLDSLELAELPPFVRKPLAFYATLYQSPT
ncbi:ubiquinone anaerobic biosynthesis accessory factor UbiT [Bowmanella denitrificans]|uniref:ubiquinone anaerobic biosynthesis accessory factor UbiT n=1 Tax=Bowmanella denitrificans TaxID=366582 RepID=UPI000C9AA365|nr:SCP2 sterol-binding domain-containing protein [Bowmanella denitrificans]